MVLVSKFTEGAWIPTALIPAIVALFVVIRRHYRRVAEQLAVAPGETIPSARIAAVVLVGPSVNRVLAALGFATAMRPELLRAVNVAFDDDGAEQLRLDWARHGINVQLDVVESPCTT